MRVCFYALIFQYSLALKGYLAILAKNKLMLLSEFLFALNQVDRIEIKTPDGAFVPPNFHITEVGKVENTLLIVAAPSEKKVSLIFNCGVPMMLSTVCTLKKPSILYDYRNSVYS